MQEEYLKNKTVLVVDDDLNLLKLYWHFLEGDDYKVIQAQNGEEALNIVREQDTDIVVSDVVMPKKNGFELCRIIKTDSRLSHIPVILVTNFDEEEKKVKALEMGADDFITKPFSYKILSAKIKSLLKNKYLQEEAKKAEKLMMFYATVVTTNHKINQPLSAILNMSELIKEDMDRLNINDKKLSDNLKKILNSANNISLILKEMRNVTKPIIGEYIKDIKMVDLEKSEKKKKIFKI